MKNKIPSLVLAMLCAMAAIPLTAFQASAAEYTVRTILPEKITSSRAKDDMRNENYKMSALPADGINYSAVSLYTYTGENTSVDAVRQTIADNVIYVSAAGSNSNNGYTSGVPLADINAAINALGGEDGKIVVMNDIDQYFDSTLIGENQSVVITGKDPVTGEIYDAFIHRQAAGQRPGFYKGHVTLEHIGDYNSIDSANNVPYGIGNAHFTIGEGYKFYVKKDGVRTLSAAQINITANGANPIVDVNSPVSQIQLMDYADSTIGEDLSINLGPNTNISGYFSLGGDTGNDSVSNCTVNGKAYVTVNGTRSDNNEIYLGGVKANSNVTLNGVQIILNDTNMTVAKHELGTYTNSGATYVVRTNALVEGSAVEKSDEFGKVNVTIPVGFKAVVKSEGGAEQTYTASGKIALPEGNSEISFVPESEITVNYDDGTVEHYGGGETLTFPAREAAEGQILYFWTMNGQRYFPGETFELPFASGTYAVTGVRIPENSVIYIDMANGNDGNDGLTAEKAFKTPAMAAQALASFKNTATLEIIGEYTDSGDVHLPAYSGILTVRGGTISSTNDIVIHSDAVLENTILNLKADYKHIVLNGKNVVFEPTVKKAENSKNLNVHAGKQNSDMTGDQSVEISGGDFANVMVGPYYISTGTEKTMNGNFNLKIAGAATVNRVTVGDGYTGVEGKAIINGDIKVTVENGAFLNFADAISTYAEAYNSFRVYNSGARAAKLNGSCDGCNIRLYNFFGVTPVAINADTITFDRAVHIENPLVNTDSSFTLALPAASGVYTVCAGIGVSAGLGIDGAQIRIADAQNKQGLRFIATYTNELAAKYEGKEYGFAIIPADVLAGAPFDAAKTYTYNNRKIKPGIVPAKLLYQQGEDFVKYTVCLTDISVDNYKTVYTVITYIKDGDSYIYGDAYSASIYDSAAEAIEKHNDGTNPLKADELAVMRQIISDADSK